jgi:hypothetical protein
MENRIVTGTCSICGGPVSVPTVWHSIIPPVPTCERCGAVAAQHGPVMPMMQPTHRTITTNRTEYIMEG